MTTFPVETRLARIGIALALYPTDPSLPMQIQRAPDDSGSPDEGAAEIIALAPSGSRTYTDIAPAGPTWYYRSRHISPAGFGSPNWTRWASATAKRLPDTLPNVPDIAAIDRWTTDIEFAPDTTEPGSAVEWTAGDLVLGNGQTHAISAGSSSTYGNDEQFYVYWDPASPTTLQDSQDFLDAVGDGVILMAICETTEDGEGELTVSPIHGLPTIHARRVVAQTLAAIVADLGIIRAGRIDDAETDPEAGIRVNDAYAKPGTWARYLDLAASGSEPFLVHPAMELLANGDATFGGLVSAESFTAPNPVFEGIVSVEGGEGDEQVRLDAVTGVGGRIRLRTDEGVEIGTLLVNDANTVGLQSPGEVLLQSGGSGNNVRVTGGNLVVFNTLDTVFVRGRVAELELFGGGVNPLSAVPAVRVDNGAAGSQPRLQFFRDSTPVGQPVVTGSRGGNAALASALAALHNLGLIDNQST